MLSSSALHALSQRIVYKLEHIICTASPVRCRLGQNGTQRRCGDADASVLRPIDALQDQLIEISHKVKEALHADAGRDSPALVSELVDQLCQVQLLHQAVHHSLELLQNAADKLLQAERATHVLVCVIPLSHVCSTVSYLIGHLALNYSLHGACRTTAMNQHLSGWVFSF